MESKLFKIKKYINETKNLTEVTKVWGFGIMHTMMPNYLVTVVAIFWDPFASDIAVCFRN